MCGIFVAIDRNGNSVDPGKLRLATSALVHRGPDDEGFLIEGRIGLGFRRLSILDISMAGHQPMTSSDGLVSIVFNGEIYNYIEIREELIGLGYKFRSTGDTEVLLNAYHAWGPECVKKFNGMWAFAIYDRRSKNLFCSRDRLGIKPLYIHMTDEMFLLSSEIKAFSAYLGKRLAENESTSFCFLVHGFLNDTEETFYKNVIQLRPGYSFNISNDGVVCREKYWDLPDEASVYETVDQRDFLELFKDSVKLQMRSDVPIGVTLSGGLDSTSIICCITEEKRASKANTSETLAFSFNAEEFDESCYIEDTIAKTSASVRFLDTDPNNLWESLEEMLFYHDEPVHSATALVGYRLMHLARENGVPVVLTGQGADEILAGYSSYFPYFWQSLIRSGRYSELWRQIGSYTDILGGSRSRILVDESIRRLKILAGYYRPYRLLSGWRNQRRLPYQNWFTSDYIGNSSSTDRDARNPYDLDSALRFSVTVDPLPLYLRIEDRNAMAHSVEARLPFLDHRLVEYAFKLPPEWKMRGPWNKYILRQALSNVIPKSVSERMDKFGFPTPVGEWFRGNLKEAAMDVLTSNQFRQMGIFDVESVLKDFTNHVERKIDIGPRLFSVIQYYIWKQKHLR